MVGRIVTALLALVGLAVLVAAAGYFILRRPDIPYPTLAAHYETAASRYQTLPSGVRLHYRDEGNQTGPVVVLVHGYSSSSQTWDGWAHRLGDRYHLIAIDLPGHGLTSAPPGYRASSEAFRDTLGEFVRARGLGHFALAGNSLGGRVAWQYALAFPDHVDALILVDSAGWRDERAAVAQPPVFQALRNPIVGPLIRDLDSTKLVRQWLEAIFTNKALVTDAMVARYTDLARAPGHRAMLSDFLQQVATQTYATPEMLAALRIPVLILWGADDALIPPAHAEQFRDAIQDAELVTFDHVGHLPQEEAPDASAAAARAFLERSLVTPTPLAPAEPPAPADAAIEPPAP